MTSPTLSADYEAQGYVVIEDAVSSADLLQIRYAAEAIVEAFDADQHRNVFSTLHQDRDRDQYFLDSAERVHCFLEEDAFDANGDLVRPKHTAINKIGHAMHDHVTEFSDFCRLPVFREHLAQLGMTEPVLWQSMYIYKQPEIGGEVRWHQDATYLIADDPGVMGIWVAVEDADRHNGCLWLEPGGHRSPLRETYQTSVETPNGTITRLDNTPWPDESTAQALEVRAGTIILFSDRMPHYSSHNHSDRSRQAFTMHCTQASTNWSEKNWLQRHQLPAFHL